MADNIDPSNIEQAEKFTKKLKDIQEEYENSVERVNEMMKVQIDAERTVADTLKEKYGAQLEFMTAIEKEAEIIEGVLDTEKEILDQKIEFAKLLEIEKDANLELSDSQKTQLNNLKQKNKEQGGILDSTKKEREEAEKKLNIDREANKEKKKQADAVGDVGKMFDNQLKQTFGLSENANNLTQSIFKAGMEGASLTDVFGKMALNLKKAFNPLTIGLTVMGKLADMTDKMMQSFEAGGGRTALMELNKDFIQATGLSSELGDSVKNMQLDLIQMNGIMSGESTKAISSLNDNFVDFTEISGDARNELVASTAVLARLGVEGNTTAGLINNLTKSSGESLQGSIKLTEGITKFARALGVGPNKMLGNLNKNFDLLSRFGTKKGVDIFKKLSAAAKATGIEFEKLIGITKGFDTFESAAESAGKLNFLLAGSGGSILNSVELLMAAPDEQLRMVKEALDAANLSAEDLQGSQRFVGEELARTLNMDTAEFFKLLEADSMSAFESMKDGANAEADASGSLASETDKNLKLAQLEKQTEEKRNAAMRGLSEAIYNAAEAFERFKGDIAGFMGVLDLLSPVLTGIIAMLGFFKAKKMFTGLLEGKGPMSTLAKSAKDAGTKFMTFIRAQGGVGKALDALKTKAQVFGKTMFTSIKGGIITAGGALKTFFLTKIPAFFGSAATFITGTAGPAIATFFTTTIPAAIGTAVTFITGTAAPAIATFFTTTIPAAIGTFMTFVSTTFIAPITAFFTTTLPVAFGVAAGALKTFFISAIGGLKTLSIAFLTNPIGLAIMAIVGVFALLYTYWDEVEGISSAVDYLADMFMSFVEALPLVAAFQYISDNWDAIVESIGNQIDNLVEMFKTAASFIASIFIEAIFALPLATAMALDFIADKVAKTINFLIDKIPEVVRTTLGIDMVPEGGFGAADAVRGFKSSIYESIGLEPAFADGTESAPGGMSLVGEEGPELVNLPGRTQVVPADETKSMMSTLDTFNKIASNNAQNSAMAPKQTKPAAGGVANLNETINVVLDGDILARHTRAVTIDTMENALMPRGTS